MFARQMMNNSLAPASMSIILVTILFVENNCRPDSLSLNRTCEYNDLLPPTPVRGSRSRTLGLRLFYLINSEAIC